MTQFFSIVWRVFVNLVEGALILAMFHIANTPFETIVISALVLIYVSVIGSYLTLGYALSRKWHIDLTWYIVIARSLGLSTELEEEAQKEDQEENQKSQAGFWITAGFNILFGFIAIGNLVYVIT